MRFVCISDLHFGDNRCGMVDRDPTTGSWDTNDRFEAFCKVAGEGNDYLVLLGDIFDFAIQSYSEAYLAGKAFLQAVAKRRLAKDILLIPGNHDSDFWHLLQYEVMVTKRIRKGQPPRPLQHAMTAVIDDRAGAQNKGLFLVPADSSLEMIKVAEERNRQGRDGIFLDRFFEEANDAEGAPKLSSDTPRVFVAYPNLYLIQPSGDCVLFTHGHLFQTPWAVASEVAIDLAGATLTDPKIVKPPAQISSDDQFGSYVPVDQMVSMNFPLIQLFCSGIGQAHPLTRMVQLLQGEVQAPSAEKPMPLVHAYYKGFPDVISRLLGLSDVARAGLKGVASLFEGWVMKKLAKVEDPKQMEGFLDDDDIVQRIGRYYLASMSHLRQINCRRPGYQGAGNIPAPTKLVFGHTHAPIPWDAPHLLKKKIDGQPLLCANTGGWLRVGKGTQEGVQAEVFIYENGQMRSTRIV